MLKIKCQHQIHLFKIDLTALGYKELKDVVKRSFKRIPKECMFVVTYLCQNHIVRSAAEFEELKKGLRELSRGVELKKIRIQIEEMFQLIQSSDNSDYFEQLPEQSTQQSLQDYIQILDESQEHDEGISLISIDDSEHHTIQLKEESFEIINRQKDLTQQIEQIIATLEEEIINSELKSKIDQEIKKYEQKAKKPTIIDEKKGENSIIIDEKKVEKKSLIKFGQIDEKMIKDSLNKYLPDFMSKISEQVAKTVRRQLLKLYKKQ